MSSLALIAVILAQLNARGSVSVELGPTLVARVDYSDNTGSHPDVAAHGKQLIRQMWAKACGPRGELCSHGPYSVSLTIAETHDGLYCIGNVA
jgi:hypothetical protein